MLIAWVKQDACSSAALQHCTMCRLVCAAHSMQACCQFVWCQDAAVGVQENHALYQRLVTIKPSKDISRDTLEREHQANEQYLHNCSTFKGSKANTVV